ncbi:4-hydroxythreonine-4-phosphate dehydrogenase [Breznakibacter xylanolyticus]|uniref:4-hydroxythreonine-4-phosphate dehydrogenase n=1 Tax=Breznakibacter xylanolyticus TaxID=990 RepID=A0A2W7PLV5_9BACT|nr:4-hydroxythreonine-4-phosphate dehydrogenase PdxA [Breznakibacter xylanolyticus]MBN2742543.1 4-hydroxythreonine-4-phosphate dehydrogenase PdxA [Marinilabiliaceae bacterium]PZX10299.1 4-hydroxythreonine-4-phosphate dehydrogenase [Breznakibacter xylanolyticus]
MNDEKIIVGITHGDINGIGYEVILKALEDPRICEICTPVIYGSSKVAAYHRKAMELPPYQLNSIKGVEEAHSKRVNIINCVDDEIRVELGKPTPMSGKAAFDALKVAVEDLKAGKIHLLVTAPINKKAIQSDEFNFPGHTEYLETSVNNGKSLMLMVSNIMKVGVVTGHVPLKEVSERITVNAIMDKLRVLNKTLLTDFAIRRPRIAVLGLNPHAGDDGLLGMEEKEVIIPAIEKAKQEGIMAMGPYAADGLFGSGQLEKFDAILAMYHDQGLAPFKTIAFADGVNFTAGLPVVRTSPDHGTAYEIAGQNKADHQSFLSALYLGLDVVKNRRIHAEISKNPLKSANKDIYDGKDVSVKDLGGDEE